MIAVVAPGRCSRSALSLSAVGRVCSARARSRDTAAYNIVRVAQRYIISLLSLGPYGRGWEDRLQVTAVSVYLRSGSSAGLAGDRRRRRRITRATQTSFRARIRSYSVFTILCGRTYCGELLSLYPTHTGWQPASIRAHERHGGGVS